MYCSSFYEWWRAWDRNPTPSPQLGWHAKEEKGARIVGDLSVHLTLGDDENRSLRGKLVAPLSWGEAYLGVLKPKGGVETFNVVTDR